MSPALLKYIVSLGSNVDECETNIREALDRLRSLHNVTAVSDIYMTEPVNGSKGAYANAVVQLFSIKSQDALDSEFKEYERSHGRDAKSRSEGRVPIDLDIVIVENEIIRPRDYIQSFFRIGYDQIIRDKGSECSR